MPGSNLAVEPYIVSGLEWDLDWRFHFGVEQTKHLEDSIELTGFLPVKDVAIPFGSNIWDFNDCFHFRSGSSFRFSFDGIPEGFVVSSKYFVLMTLLNSNSKVTTIYRRFQDLKPFFKEMDSCGIMSPAQITAKDIRTYLDQYIKNHSAKSSSMVKIALLLYAQFLTVNYDYPNKIDLSLFESYNWLAGAVEKQRIANKTPNIPDDYYDQLLSTLVNVMNNSNASYNHRATACLYIIMSQTGLRISEIHALTKDSLKEISVKNVDKAYFLEVREFKPASRQQEYVKFNTFANELTVEAFTKLWELSKTRMLKRKTDFLYLPECKNIPAPDHISLRHFKNLLFLYAPFAVVPENGESPYEGLDVVKAVIGKDHYGFVATPTTKQFRVHVCTELYYTHHVSLLFIQKCMGHLSDEMQGYYVRPKNKAPEEAEASQKLLKDVLQKNVTLLGGKGKEISERIDQFIAESNFRVEDNLDELMSYLDGKVAIRVKKSGFCVKATEYRECSRDAKTNEIFCAYNICPNLCHVYYMAADSYEDFKLLQSTFYENDRNGFELQASKELRKLKNVCRQRLIPEMEDMKKKIQLRGIANVLVDYPQLEPIIRNYDAILEEVELWTAKSY